MNEIIIKKEDLIDLMNRVNGINNKNSNYRFCIEDEKYRKLVNREILHISDQINSGKREFISKEDILMDAMSKVNKSLDKEFKI